jgi:hypothetical protein
MAGMERLIVGVNGAVVGARDHHGRRGYVFEAPDGTRGPFHLRIGRSSLGFWRAFAAARNDWQAWADQHPSR